MYGVGGVFDGGESIYLAGAFSWVKQAAFSIFCRTQYTMYSLPTTFAVRFFGYAKVKA